MLADLGAGEGAILYALERAGLVRERIYAVDLEERALATAARVSPKVTAIVADVADVAGLADGSVDAVVSSQVIEHLPDDRALAAEIARILRPGGWFYVSSVARGPHAWWFRRGRGRWQLDSTHVREYASAEAFAAALAHPGLAVEEMRSRPLRFPLADPLARLAGASPAAFERSRPLALARRAVRVRVPGYRWVEAIGRRR